MRKSALAGHSPSGADEAPRCFPHVPLLDVQDHRRGCRVAEHGVRDGQQNCARSERLSSRFRTTPGLTQYRGESMLSENVRATGERAYTRGEPGCLLSCGIRCPAQRKQRADALRKGDGRWMQLSSETAEKRGGVGEGGHRRLHLNLSMRRFNSGYLQVAPRLRARRRRGCLSCLYSQVLVDVSAPVRFEME